MIRIISANEKHISDVAPLFDAYRVFYNQESDMSAGKRFLEERFAKGETIIFLAFDADQPIGFTQLYTTFSSVSLQPLLILNDLFVAPSHRKKGVGEALLNHAKAYCTLMKYKGLALETAHDNPAQQLYERLGWQKDMHCFHYFWTA